MYMYCDPLTSANLNLSFNFIILNLCYYESVAIILAEDVHGFKSTVRSTLFTCFAREKGLENWRKSQDCLISCPIVNV